MLFILEDVTRGPETTHEQLNTKPALGAWVPCNTHSGKDLLLSVLGAGKGVTANHACLRCVSMPTLLPDFIQERPAPVSLHKAEVL